MSDEETISLIQQARNESGLGPIEDYNMPGYVSPALESRGLVVETSVGEDEESSETIVYIKKKSK